MVHINIDKHIKREKDSITFFTPFVIFTSHRLSSLECIYGYIDLENNTYVTLKSRDSHEV